MDSAVRNPSFHRLSLHALCLWVGMPAPHALVQGQYHPSLSRALGCGICSPVLDDVFRTRLGLARRRGVCMPRHCPWPRVHCVAARLCRLSRRNRGQRHRSWIGLRQHRFTCSSPLSQTPLLICSSSHCLFAPAPGCSPAWQSLSFRAVITARSYSSIREATTLCETSWHPLGDMPCVSQWSDT